MAANQSIQIDGGVATIAWQTLYALTTYSGVPALPVKVRELVITNRDASANLYLCTARPNGTAPGVTAGDFLRAEQIVPGGGTDLIRGSDRSINTTEVLVACATGEGAVTCAFSFHASGV